MWAGEEHLALAGGEMASSCWEREKEKPTGMRQGNRFFEPLSSTSSREEKDEVPPLLLYRALLTRTTNKNTTSWCSNSTNKHKHLTSQARHTNDRVCSLFVKEVSKKVVFPFLKREKERKKERVVGNPTRLSDE